MLLFKKENLVSNPSELRTSLLELTYYNSTNHPNKLAGTEWSSVCNITQELSDETGNIKTAIDEVITSINDNSEITVNDFEVYSQYFTQSENEPPIQRFWYSGFDPLYHIDQVAILYMPHEGWKSTFEFWDQEEDLSEVETTTLSSTIELDQNDLIVFSSSKAHRFKPSTWGNFNNDSGLMLIFLLKVS